MKTNSKDVFISHIHEDDAGLRDLKNLLARGNYEIRDSSIDSSKPNKARSEEYIKREILAPRIRWASTLIVLISRDTHKHKYVDWEIEYAQKEDKRIVGVFVQGGKDSDVPKNLDLYADAVVGWDSGKVIDAITGKTNDWVAADGTVRPPRSIARYSCV